MDWSRGRFRTTDGEVSVDDEAVRIHRRPKTYLRSQFARWYSSGYAGRAVAACKVGLFLSIPVLLFSRVFLASGSDGSELAFALVALAGGLFTVWRRFYRPTEIPLADVSDVTLDPDERTLTVTFDAGGRLFGPGGRKEGRGLKSYWSDDPFRGFETGTTERTTRLPTDDDVREARSAFRLVDLDVGDPPAETDTEYRVVTESGVVFCESCRSQVSPSDRACPACGYELHVHSPVEPDRRERSVEY